MISSIRPEQSHQFQVTELPRNNHGTRLLIQKVANSWRQLAKSLAVNSAEKKAIFEASQKVNEISFQRTQRPGNFKKLFRVALITSKDETIFAFALFKPIQVLEIKDLKLRKRTFLHLNYLSSDPSNLTGDFRIKGVGKMLIDFLIKTAIQEGYEGVFTEPLPQSRSYFEGLNFIPLSRPGTRKYAMYWQP